MIPDPIINPFFNCSCTIPECCFSCMPCAQVIREWARTALGPGATGQSVAPREYLVMLRAAVDASLSPNDATYSDDREALLLDGLIRWLTDTQQFGARPFHALVNSTSVGVKNLGSCETLLLDGLVFSLTRRE